MSVSSLVGKLSGITIFFAVRDFPVEIDFSTLITLGDLNIYLSPLGKVVYGQT